MRFNKPMVTLLLLSGEELDNLKKTQEEKKILFGFSEIEFNNLKETTNDTKKLSELFLTKLISLEALKEIGITIRMVQENAKIDLLEVFSIEAKKTTRSKDLLKIEYLFFTKEKNELFRLSIQYKGFNEDGAIIPIPVYFLMHGDDDVFTRNYKPQKR